MQPWVMILAGFYSVYNEIDLLLTMHYQLSSYLTLWLSFITLVVNVMHCYVFFLEGGKICVITEA